MADKTIRPPIELHWPRIGKDGKQLLFSARLASESLPVAAIVADAADESLWLQVHLGDQAVQLPLELVKEAILAAERDVHSEAWVDYRDVLGDQDA
jgi:hypothetical protein